MAHGRGLSTLLVVAAHPDDESFGCGALIASAAADGRRVVVACASRGELGEDASGLYSDRASLAAAREAELHASAALLGVDEVILLGMTDSGWDGEPQAGSIVAEPGELVRRIADVLVEHRPAVVVTMDPAGSDGHRDHAAVGQATTTAFDQSVDWPATLYHWCLPRSLMDAWAREIAAQNADSVYLETELGRADADVTTILDGSAVLERVWKAIGTHRTQVSPYDGVSKELADRFVRLDHLVRQRPPWPDFPVTPALEHSMLWPSDDPDRSRR